MDCKHENTYITARRWKYFYGCFFPRWAFKPWIFIAILHWFCWLWAFFCCFLGGLRKWAFCTSDILILEKDIKIGIYSGVINICILSCDGKFFLCEKTEKVVRALEWGVGSRELWNCWVEIRFIWGAKKKKKLEASSRSSTISSF